MSFELICHASLHLMHTWLAWCVRACMYKCAHVNFHRNRIFCVKKIVLSEFDL
jgi:hypothetical protein